MKSLLLTFLFTILCTVSYAQKSIMFGITASRIHSWPFQTDFVSFPNASYQSTGYKLLGGGIDFQYNFTRAFGLATAINYTQRGYWIDVENQLEMPTRIAQQFNYLTVPLLVTWQPKVNGNLGIIARLGADADFMLSNFKGRTNSEQEILRYSLISREKAYRISGGPTAGCGIRIKTENAGIFEIGADFHLAMSYSPGITFRIQETEVNNTHQLHYVSYTIKWFFLNHWFKNN